MPHECNGGRLFRNAFEEGYSPRREWPSTVFGDRVTRPPQNGTAHPQRCREPHRAADLVKVKWQPGETANVSEQDIQQRAAELIADPKRLRPDGT
jgi:hypothetical protein